MNAEGSSSGVCCPNIPAGTAEDLCPELPSVVVLDAVQPFPDKQATLNIRLNEKPGLVLSIQSEACDVFRRGSKNEDRDERRGRCCASEAVAVRCRGDSVTVGVQGPPLALERGVQTG